MDNCEELLNPFYTELNSELASNSLNFPTSFDLLTRSTRIMDNPNSSIRDYALLIQSEPVLFAKVLRMANSAAINPSGREVTTAFEAVQRLGTKKIRCLTYLVVMEQVRQDIRTDELKKIANTIWKHSVDVASLSYFISKETKVCDPDEALLAAIMIDVGQFYIISKLPHYPLILKNEKCCAELIKQAHQSIAKQIIDTMKMPRVVIDFYDSQLSYHPVWPLADICDVIMLANINTNFKNPYLYEVDNFKKQLFNEELSDSGITELDEMLNKIDTLKNELFKSMSS